MNLVQEMPLATESRLRDPSIFQAIRALLDTLDDVHDFITNLTAAQYAAKPAIAQSSVGSHVRHCLDHVQALIRGLTDGCVDYDTRERGTDVERSPSAALQRLTELRGTLDRSVPVMERYLFVRSMLTADGDTIRAHSSWSRELVFVLSHTIHHQAMMAASARAVGATINPRFGYAPSTLAHLDRTPCAPSA